MDDMLAEIKESAERAVEMSRDRDADVLDYRESSLRTLDAILAETAEYAPDLGEEQLQMLAQDFGCYVLETARRAHGGAYQFDDERQAPMLVTGEPACQVALLTWDKVRARLTGGSSDGIASFYDGFAARAKQAKPGDRVVFV